MCVLFFHFFAVLENIMTYLEFISQNKSGGPQIGFYQGRKLYWSWSNMNKCRHLQREWENLSSAFEKTDSEWEQIFERRHRRT